MLLVKLRPEGLGFTHDRYVSSRYSLDMVNMNGRKRPPRKINAIYRIAKVLVSVYLAMPFLSATYYCYPSLDLAGATSGSCLFLPQMIIPLAGLLIFTFSKWPLLGGLIAFIAGHFIYIPGVLRFSWGIDSSTYPGSMYSFLPNHGGMVFIHCELILLLLWSLIEQLVLKFPRRK